MEPKLPHVHLNPETEHKVLIASGIICVILLLLYIRNRAASASTGSTDGSASATDTADSTDLSSIAAGQAGLLTAFQNLASTIQGGDGTTSLPSTLSLDLGVAGTNQGSYTGTSSSSASGSGAGGINIFGVGALFGSGGRSTSKNSSTAIQYAEQTQYNDSAQASGSETFLTNLAFLLTGQQKNNEAALALQTNEVPVVTTKSANG